MSENTIWGEETFVERFERYLQSMRETQPTVEELFANARTLPGGDWDTPFAPIDPAYSAAANRIVIERKLVNDFSMFTMVQRIEMYTNNRINSGKEVPQINTFHEIEAPYQEYTPTTKDYPI